MIGKVLRVCRTCGDRRHVFAATSEDRGRIVRGERQCAACQSRERQRPPTGSRPVRSPDTVVVARLLAGHSVPSMIDDRIEATRRLTDRSATQIATLLGVSDRTVVRYRQEIRA